MRLLDYKARHGLTLVELAAQLGFGVSTVHGWLSYPHRQPSPGAVLAIVRATRGAVRGEDLRKDLAAAAQIERAKPGAALNVPARYPSVTPDSKPVPINDTSAGLRAARNRTLR